MSSYRPDSQLRRLHHEQDCSSCRSSPLRLRWLRTLNLDLTDIHHNINWAEEALQAHKKSVPACAVEHVKLVYVDRIERVQAYLTESSMMHLTTLNLRKQHVSDSFFVAIAPLYHAQLRRLYLPPGSHVAQSVLDCFTQLEELDCSFSFTVTNVHFCSATLRVLYASSCGNLSDEGLAAATRLRVLHAHRCAKVTTVAPFAHSLFELDAGSSNIDSQSLAQCHALQVLHPNQNVRSLEPFAAELKELTARGSVHLDDAALQRCTSLVRLDVTDNDRIRTVEPFATTLRELRCEGSSAVGTTGLCLATSIVVLHATGNRFIHNMKSFVSNLLQLAALGSQIRDVALRHATSLLWLESGDGITTVAPFAHSLRHLVTHGARGLTNQSLASATKLVTLDCAQNANITTIAPFAQSLESLVAGRSFRSEGIAPTAAAADSDGPLRWVQLTHNRRQISAKDMEALWFVHVGDNEWIRY